MLRTDATASAYPICTEGAPFLGHGNKGDGVGYPQLGFGVGMVGLARVWVHDDPFARIGCLYPPDKPRDMRRGGAIDTYGKHLGMAPE